jgi:hypothetical protein
VTHAITRTKRSTCAVNLAIAAVALIAIAVGAASLPILAGLEPTAHVDRVAAPRPHPAVTG